MIRAALYARVSTEEQAQRYSIGAQLERLREYARQRGYSVVAEYVDDGWSGAFLDRPALTRLREAVAQGQVDVVLVYDPDRLSRDLADLLSLDKEFRKAGVRLETITTELDGSPEGRMFFQFKGALAEYERAIIGRRTIDGHRRKAREGKVVNPRCLPRWLRYDRQTGTVMLDEEWAQVVRLAYWLVDIGNLHQREKHVTPFMPPEIQRQRTLASPLHSKPLRAPDLTRDLPHDVTPNRVLYFDNLRPELGEQGAHERTREVVGQLQHPQPRKGTSRLHPHLRSEGVI